MPEILFYGVPAYVGLVESATRCGFWAEQNNGFSYDQRNLVHVDIAKNPVDLPPERWGEVEVDATEYHDPRGLTTICRTFNSDETYIGRVYLSERKYLEYREKVQTLPPSAPDEMYQYISSIRTAGPAVLRYHSFKVKLLDKGASPVMKVAITESGKRDPVSVQYLDFDDPQMCAPDVALTGMPAITKTSKVNDVGYLFLSWSVIYISGLHIPKLPPNFRNGQLPNMRLEVDVEGTLRGASRSITQALAKIREEREP